MTEQLTRTDSNQDPHNERRTLQLQTCLISANDLHLQYIQCMAKNVCQTAVRQIGYRQLNDSSGEAIKGSFDRQRAAPRPK